MRKVFSRLIITCSLICGAIGSANANTVTIPDPSPNDFIFIGNGDASVTYAGVTFSQQAALSDGNFFNIGPLFSFLPAVLSSQEQTTGVANILITFPEFVSGFSLNYGTFGGSDVTFLLSNGDTFTLGSTASGDYSVPDFASDPPPSPFNSVLITSPDLLNINNISYTPAVPEPSSLALLGLGGLSLAIGAYRRRRAD